MTSVASILEPTAHRPWPIAERPWRMFMRWCDLAFLHWPVEASEMAPLLPAGLELDTYEGQAWLGIVPFRMEAVRYRWCPPFPTAAAFPEINVRTYVRAGTRAGVWFFSLDAASWSAVRGARLLMNLPYFDAQVQTSNVAGRVNYASRRIHRGAASALFQGSYQAVGPLEEAAPGTLEHWLTERYCLFGQSRSGQLYHVDVQHAPWPLQRAEATIEHNTMAQAAGIHLPAAPPLVHFASTLDVLAWGRVAV